MLFTSSLLHHSLPVVSARLAWASDTNGRSRGTLSLRRGSKAGKRPDCRKHKGKLRPKEQKVRTERIIASRQTKLFARAEVRATFVLYVQTVCYLYTLS